MILYKKTVNKFNKEKLGEGNKKGDRVVQDENGNIKVYRQASDDWF